jgi:hypothetical protein
MHAITYEEFSLYKSLVYEISTKKILEKVKIFIFIEIYNN